MTRERTLDTAIIAGMRQFRAAVDRADLNLDARRCEYFARINRSAQRVARLESELENCQASFPYRVEETRVQLVAAIESHHSEVDGANNWLRYAVDDYVVAASRAASDWLVSLASARVQS